MQISPPFFSFTAQGLAIIGAIVGVGWKIVIILRKFDRNFSMWLWEHDVMWAHHKKHHDVPIFPSLNFERRRHPRTEQPEYKEENQT